VISGTENIVISGTEKVRRGCGQMKPPDEFYRCGRDKRASRCKDCDRRRNRERIAWVRYYADNKIA
jgi:hypothetical protein